MLRTVDKSLQKLGCREEGERATDRQMETDQRKTKEEVIFFLSFSFSFPFASVLLLLFFKLEEI